MILRLIPVPSVSCKGGLLSRRAAGRLKVADDWWFEEGLLKNVEVVLLLLTTRKKGEGERIVCGVFCLFFVFFAPNKHR